MLMQRTRKILEISTNTMICNEPPPIAWFFEHWLAELPGPYGPPRGALLVARADGASAGCVLLRPLDDETAEIKRLYEAGLRAITLDLSQLSGIDPVGVAVIGFRAEPVITIVSLVWRASWIVAAKMWPIHTAATASESRPRKSSGTA